MTRLLFQFAVLLLCTLTFTKQDDYRRPTKITTNCCKEVSSSPFSFKATGYYHQNALPPCVEAIVFVTERGKVCSDVTARWIQRKIKGIPEIK